MQRAGLWREAFLEEAVLSSSLSGLCRLGQRRIWLVDKRKAPLKAAQHPDDGCAQKKTNKKLPSARMRSQPSEVTT
jgi:hypothetical protein